MKNIIKKIKIAIITFAFLGVSASGMLVLAENPVMAAEQVYKSGAKTGYTIPSEIKIKKGETKTITLQTPKGSKDVTNVAWGYQTNQNFTVISTSPGSYWGKPATITIKGNAKGTGYIYSYAEVFNKKGNSNSYKYTAEAKCTVTVTDTNTSGNKNNTTATAKKPLKSISLNNKSLNLQKGKNYTLKVSYNPSNTTDPKTIKWSSSNSSVATINGGYVVAKGVGTATITANVNGKKAACTVKVTASNTGSKTSTHASKGETYKNVSDAYTITNKFRTTRSNQWYWNQGNKTKTYTYGLKALSRDGVLENIAKQRAKEQWTQYYVNGKLTHNRLNGTSCWTAYTKGSNPCGENLAWGHKNSNEVVYAWAETNCNYNGQGHRRAMLSNQAKRIGIACYEKDGKTCWAMCLGR